MRKAKIAVGRCLVWSCPGLKTHTHTYARAHTHTHTHAHVLLGLLAPASRCGTQTHTDTFRRARGLETQGYNGQKRATRTRLEQFPAPLKVCTSVDRVHARVRVHALARSDTHACAHRYRYREERGQAPTHTRKHSTPRGMPCTKDRCVTPRAMESLGGSA